MNLRNVNSDVKNINENTFDNFVRNVWRQQNTTDLALISEKIKKKLMKTGCFKNIQVVPIRVTDATDVVDLEISVEELGRFEFSAGGQLVGDPLSPSLSANASVFASAAARNLVGFFDKIRLGVSFCPAAVTTALGSLKFENVDEFSSLQESVIQSIKSDPRLSLLIPKANASFSCPFSILSRNVDFAFDFLMQGNDYFGLTGTSEDLQSANATISYGGHTARASVVARMINTFDDTPMITVSTDPPKTIKYSLFHMWQKDFRDHPASPVKGLFFSLSNELALPLPSFVVKEMKDVDYPDEKEDVLLNTKSFVRPKNILEYLDFTTERTTVFLKHVLAAQYHLPLNLLSQKIDIIPGTALHFSGRAGLMWNPFELVMGEKMMFKPLRTIPSDRFYLSDVVTGFKNVNPRDKAFSLGGDAFYTLRTEISVPLGSMFNTLIGDRAKESDIIKSTFGTRTACRVSSLIEKSPFSIRATAFVSAGNVVPLYDGIATSTLELLKASRLSVGVGISGSFKNFRGYVNLAAPLLRHEDSFTITTFGFTTFYK